MKNEKKFLKPKTVKEAIRLATENESDFCFLAGGTDVLVNEFQGNGKGSCLIDITGIRELKKVNEGSGFLTIGPLVSLDELSDFPEIINNFPALIEAAHEAASPVIRRTATLGGNLLCENRCVYYNQSEWWRDAVGNCLKCKGEICIATGGKKNCFSKFVSDTAPVLIAMNSLIEVVDKSETKIIPLESIYTGDGIKPRNLSKTSLITKIILPAVSPAKVIFKKLRPRAAVDFTSLTTAVSLNNKGDIRIVLGGVDPKPVLAEGNVGKKGREMINSVVKKARIVDNDFYSRPYRKAMIPVFLERSFAELGI